MPSGRKIKILVVFGTRPEAIKMAPLVKELQKSPNMLPIVAVTAQHREMLDQVLDLFEIKPHYDLNIMRHGQTLSEITGRVLEGIENIIVKERPDLVLVHGDTTTTFASALAAFYEKTPVGHVEAGLRTRDKYAPFPEEMNRRLTGALADFHFAPTEAARENLLKEGVSRDSIFVTGNTVIDALFASVNPEYRFEGLLGRLDFKNRRIILVTAHRRENWGKPMEEIFSALAELVDMFSDVEVVFPVHKNPAIQALAKKLLGGRERVHLIEPLEYAPFVNLMARCYLVLTDSGGLQEEAPALGKPVLVLREITERPEAVEAGTVRLVGFSRSRIVRETRRLLLDEKEYQAMANAVNPYGDGKASYRIRKWLEYSYGLSSEIPAEFSADFGSRSYKK
ncbi:MAG: UDP-N-acetylglucosamine 2-epimerase [Clostridia bacterium 41_269]|nr:MAG: UDP-N-acetylglucosamine 2-epimerase [Clostridia bacterium 41_269]